MNSDQGRVNKKNDNSIVDKTRKEKILTLCAKKIDTPPQGEKWGTSISEFRGNYFQIFGLITSNAPQEPFSEYPYKIHAIRKYKENGDGNEYLEILSVLGN